MSFGFNWRNWSFISATIGGEWAYFSTTKQWFYSRPRKTHFWFIYHTFKRVLNNFLPIIITENSAVKIFLTSIAITPMICNFFDGNTCCYKIYSTNTVTISVRIGNLDRSGCRDQVRVGSGFGLLTSTLKVSGSQKQASSDIFSVVGVFDSLF